MEQLENLIKFVVSLPVYISIPAGIYGASVAWTPTVRVAKTAWWFLKKIWKIFSGSYTSIVTGAKQVSTKKTESTIYIKDILSAVETALAGQHLMLQRLETLEKRIGDLEKHLPVAKPSEPKPDVQWEALTEKS